MQKGARFYEGLVRVPLIFSWPGYFQQDLRSKALVELFDMSQTLLELAGIQVPDYFQGQSLLPILEGQVLPERLREFVRCEYFDALDPHFTGGSGTFATMHRTERYKLSIYHDKDLGELYDLQEDPWEFDDLWNNPAYQAVKHRLIYESFNAHVVLTTDVGSQRIAPM